MGPAHTSRLRHFPVSWFATVMGLTGFAVAWGHAGALIELPPGVALLLTAFAGALFVLLSGLYLAKFIRHRDAVRAEWRHPVRVNFVPTLSISLILLGTATLAPAPELSYWLWSAGCTLNLLLTLYVMNFWLNHREFLIHHMNPAWFIPVVGNILVPLAGITHATAELSWFFFSIGLFFWLALFTIIFYRVIFHEPIAERLMPTLVILIAPPAVGFLSYTTIIGHVDAFGRVLYYLALFLTLLLFTQIRRFARLQFFLSWWAYSFPLAAFTIATLRMYHYHPLRFFELASWTMLMVLTAIIAMLVVRTLIAVARREICVEER